MLKTMRHVYALFAAMFMAAAPPAKAELAAEAAASIRAPEAVISGLLGQERNGLGSFLSSPDIVWLAGLPASAEEEEQGDGAVSALDRHRSHDEKTARLLDGTRDRILTELLVADPGGMIDLEAIRRVRVGEKSKEWRCLSEGLYFEARGESVVGQMAVAEVILNRVDSARYPDTVCEVLMQGASRRNACQFSYNCDGNRNAINEPEAFELAGKIAWVMLEGRPRTLTGKATHYHTTAVSPVWSKRLTRTARIGEHLFYRRDTKLSQR